ncbi:peptidyl-tRNA hydrolase ICT1, mitochondrial [Acanthochromis polyacanthus]|uniref:Large ribosomal subunit protein mL62 n=1 Tax=Acanthochromis polyacanthus TaxID=80966 RepID=A0A3Q1G4G5_9TELE|nr:peptidyl-tRNA hydrolase ICT1, mitochondrial [Acanthochromis polyacanthus]
MAASMALRSYLLCRNTGLNAVLQHAPLKSFVLRHSNSTSLQLSVSYGTRGTDDTEDTQVHIPVERLTVSFSRSSGPGGQHVNKVSTKAEVRFHVLTADWIPQDVRQKISEKNKNRINKAGELLVTSELSRSQQRNLSDCITKISAIIAEASEKPYEPTAEDIALRAARLEKRNKERLKQKKIHSATKHRRRVDFD